MSIEIALSDQIGKAKRRNAERKDKKKRKHPENGNPRFFLISIGKTLKDDELQSAVRIILIKTRKPKMEIPRTTSQDSMSGREMIP